MSSRFKRLVVAAVVVPFVLTLSGCTIARLALGISLGHVAIAATATSKYCVHQPNDVRVRVLCSLGFGNVAYTSIFTMVFFLIANLEAAEGSMMDPVVVQVPAGATGFRGTYTDGAGASGALAITAGLTQLPIDANSSLVAEAGMQLVLIDFPSPFATAPGAYRYTFDYDGGTNSIKAITVGVLQANGRTYYPPISSCITSFAEVPPIAIPESATPVDVAPQSLGTPIPCAEKTYSFPAAAPAAGSVEVVEYYHSGLDHFFVTWIPDEIAKLDAGTVIRGWARTGRTFRAFTAAQPGTSPVCRFYLPPAFGDSHFYGRGTAECDATSAKFPGFVLEEPRFMHLYLPTAGVCPANTTAVHRVFSNRADANHRYTTDSQVAATMVGRGWVAEGDGPDLVVMCAPM